MRIFNKFNILLTRIAVFGCMAPLFAQTLSWTEYAVPSPLGSNGAVLGAVIPGPDGAMWFNDGDWIGRITTTGSVTYPDSSASILIDYYSLVFGSDGAIWFVSTTSIVRMSTAGVFTNYPLPTGAGTLSSPIGITPGPDGALWFTAQGGGGAVPNDGGGIGRITTSGSFTEYPFPPGMSGAQQITTGPDGALWFTMGNGGNNEAIGRVTTTGSFTSYPFTSITQGNTEITSITTGSDGALWFFVPTTASIGRITTGGDITQFQMMTFSYFTTGSINMISGPDGALWLAGDGAQILRVTTSGQQTVFSNPPDPHTDNLSRIDVGPDGALWMTGIGEGPNGTNAQKIFRIALTQPDAFFTGEQLIANGIYYLQFEDGTPFGYYGFTAGSAATATAWMYHFDLGYEYVTAGDVSGDLYFYDLASSHWWYTSPSLFPYFYDFTLNSWIYYFPNTSSPGHYTTNPRYFSNLATGKIFTM